jgi:raffinose/stachyose/melibiose transport system permease protein
MRFRPLLLHGLQYAILMVLFLLFMFPFGLLLLNSFKTNGEIMESVTSWPTAFNLDNFRDSFIEMNYMRSFLNSAVITFCSVAIILILSAMTAYWFVRSKTRLNNALFLIIVASMIIPFQSIMIPLVSIYGNKLGWMIEAAKQTLIFFYIGFGTPLAVFIYHGFIKSIPIELEQAAIIDGCTSKQTFFKIVLPLLKSTSVTIAILHILWIWNDFLMPLIVLQNTGKRNYTLPLAIQVFRDFYSTDFAKFLPGLLMTILPVIMIYILSQRYIIQGVVQGAVK